LNRKKELHANLDLDYHEEYMTATTSTISSVHVLLGNDRMLCLVLSHAIISD